ncbi:MAG: ATP-binding protein [Alphaproteobacteria bacterium]
MSTDHDKDWNGFIEGQSTAFEAAVASSLTDARRFITAAGLANGAGDRLLIVVEEIMSNIVGHAAPPPGSAITWRFAVEEGQVRLRFADAGTYFDPRGTVAAPPDGDTAITAAATEGAGGLGWRLVLAWCDIAVCEPDNGINRLELVMRPQLNAA